MTGVDVFGDFLASLPICKLFYQYLRLQIGSNDPFRRLVTAACSKREMDFQPKP
jgi:hypothetical protein